MKTLQHTLIVCFITSSLCNAAPSEQKRLTPKRIHTLTATENAPELKECKVAISGLTSAFPADFKHHYPEPTVVALRPNERTTVKVIREVRCGTEFDPPQVSDAENEGSEVTPITTTAFETLETGWTIRLHARQVGPIILLSGVAEFAQLEMVNGGYGALSGPIHNEQGDILIPNSLQQPVVRKTVSRFHLFAVPGEAYDVLLYQGNQAEKHTIKVSAK